jgi:fumarate reductase flavoprotein subunit
VLVRAKAVLLATGGGPTMYAITRLRATRAATAWRWRCARGCRLRDMEMVQFHPTGLLAGMHTRMTGTVLEEGLRGAGGYLLNGAKERFMPRYDPKAERATRDFVSRAMYSEMRAGHTTPHGGLYIAMAHLGPENVRKQFRGMVERCADCGFDLAGGLVEVVPTAHYMMGGVEFAADCSTVLPGLFVAGEDSGGVHGANRLGGNGVANSTVFGAIAGDSMAAWIRKEGMLREPDRAAIEAARERCERPLRRAASRPRQRSKPCARSSTRRCGKGSVSFRDAAGLDSGARGAALRSTQDLDSHALSDSSRTFNLSWHDWMNLKNLVRDEPRDRGKLPRRARIREARISARISPTAGALEQSAFTSARLCGDALEISMKPVAFTRVKPGESLLREAA